MKVNGFTLTKEQEELWKRAMEFKKSIKTNAIKNKHKFKHSVACSICEELIGYSIVRDVEAICKECEK